MSILTPNTQVKLHNDTYNTTTEGTLHLPDTQYFHHTQQGITPVVIPQTVEENTYGTHTIILPNGRKFRTTGTLTAA